MAEIGILNGAMEKTVAAVYEVEKRPTEKIHRPWLEQLHQQTKDGMEAVDKLAVTPWINGEKITQADVSTVVFWDSIKQVRPNNVPTLECPKLVALSEKANSLTAFSDTYKVRGY